MDNQIVTNKTLQYNNKEYYCALKLCMDLIGGKWKPLTLFHLIKGKKRSHELQKSICGISSKVFTQTVRELERDGLIERTVYATVPPKVEYELTETGSSLIPILKMMHQWGSEVGSY